MIIRLDQNNSLLNRFVAELRTQGLQDDKARFRKNLFRIGQIFAYEISKKLKYTDHKIQTPLGIGDTQLEDDDIILATILRAGLPFHSGMLDYLEYAENAFITSYRSHHKDGSFEIKMEYLTCPSVDGKVVILSDPMLATGSSIDKALHAISELGKPKKVIVASIIASSYGIKRIARLHPKVDIWVHSEDEELTGKSYIVPGLGDAGDLAFGSKSQE